MKHSPVFIDAVYVFVSVYVISLVLVLNIMETPGKPALIKTWPFTMIQLTVLDLDSHVVTNSVLCWCIGKSVPSIFSNAQIS